MFALEFGAGLILAVVGMTVWRPLLWAVAATAAALCGIVLLVIYKFLLVSVIGIALVAMYFANQAEQSTSRESEA
jgi:hypothetical protein